jgi:hypothetical protein
MLDSFLILKNQRNSTYKGRKRLMSVDQYKVVQNVKNEGK